MPLASSPSEWTVGGWVRVGSLSQNSAGIIEVGRDGGGWMLNIGNGAGGVGGKLSVLLGGVAWLDSGYAFPDTTSNRFVVARRSAGVIQCSVDGVVLPAMFTNVPAAPTAEVTLGAQETAAGAYQRHFSGTIDEPAIWDRALTADEVAMLYRVGMGR